MAMPSALQQFELLGQSPAVCALREDIACAARSEGKVLISGESGSGKEIAARLIHLQGARHRMPIVTLNCAGVPETLLESELFGHTRGSFTGAYRDKPGLLSLGHRGTVFLDEIGEMSLRMQSMLLRFLETGEIQRVGATRAESSLDVRIITATNRDLTTLIAEKTFREDLYYRLNVLHIVVPPLRSRREDIPALVEFFFRRQDVEYGIAPPVVTADAMRRLVSYDWPGNVRELRNVCERMIARRGSLEIGVHDLPKEIHETQTPTAVAPAPQDTADALFTRMVQHGETFWTAVYHPFMSRDLTRQLLQAIVARGLEETRGNYRMLVELFNMPADDYKRFLNFLRKHRCHVPFQRFRGSLARIEAPRRPSLVRREHETAVAERGSRF
jgi:DNA-binding NtrC family response regulator